MILNRVYASPWLAYGFRPFFLLAALYAPIALVPWVGTLLQQFTLPMAMMPVAWHGHEMLFGFANAALAGFLLTSVPSWADVSPLAGRPLAALTLLWLAGRLAFWSGGALPDALVAVVNITFALLLLAWAAPALLSAAGRRHLNIGLVLTFWVVVQALFYVAWLWPELGLPSMLVLLNTAVNVLLVLIALVASRILRVVAMAARAELGLAGPPRLTPAREHLAVAVLILFVIADFVAPGHSVTGWIALSAAAAQADRLSEWPWSKSMGRLYLLLLTSAYLWMTAGLLLVGIAALVDWLPAYAGRHGLSAGAAGSAILAVFCIAGIRHSGRPLQRLPLLIWPALVALIAAVLLRNLVPLWWPEYYLIASIGLPFVLWLLVWLFYLLAYGRFLVTVRADGLPG